MAAQLKKWVRGMMFEFPNLVKLTYHHTKFIRTEDLQGELDGLKTAIKEHVKLSPLDVNRPLWAWLDAAKTVGMSYILVQPKSDNEADGVTIISCDSTNFKAGQKGYSAFEAEVACAQWFTSKEDYFIRGAPEVILKSDAKNLDGLLRTELGKIENPRLQKMCERMMPYNLRVENVRGVDNNIADFGSRYPRNTSEGE